MARRKPAIFTGPAAQYVSGGEIIREFAFPSGRGGLISLRTTADGVDVIEIYRTDPEVDVRAAKPEPHRALPDSDSEPGDRCKVCSRPITWMGPTQYDWQHCEES